MIALDIHPTQTADELYVLHPHNIPQHDQEFLIQAPSPTQSQSGPYPTSYTDGFGNASLQYYEPYAIRYDSLSIFQGDLPVFTPGTHSSSQRPQHSRMAVSASSV